ncbi:MAG: PAS domain S-box protein, partial [Actinomycetes bacterium]
DITEQRRAQRAIARERDRAQSYLDIAGVMLVAIGADQNVLFANRKACEVLERDESEIVGHNWFDLAIPEAERETIRAGFAQLMADNVAPWEHVENLVATGSGVEKSVAWHNTVIRDDEGTIVATLSSGDDITESKRTERLMAVPSEILRIIASPAPVRETVGGIVAALKEATGYDAVGMRLEQDGDYPFIGSLGYTDEFLAAENVLAERSPDDELCRNADGSISLECTCGLVISGAADPENPLFTPGGSAWTNDSLPFLDVPPEEDPRLHPRNRCIHVGFRSLALVPLRAGDEILGLLHLGDSHTDRLTLDMVHFFEGLGASIGVAIQSKQVEEALRQSKAMRDITEAAAHVGSVRRDLVTGQSTWSPETYRLFALAPDESVGDTAAIFERCVHPGDRARLEEAAGGVRATGRAGPVEFRVIWPDGSEHILHGESITECDPDGEPVAITGYYQDVTEQRRVEAAIYESELKYRTVADNTYDWEWWTAPDGTYRYVSPGCERITGYSVEEFLADPGLLPAITHPDDDGALRAHLAPEVQEASAEDRLEFRIITKAGDERVIDHRCRGVYDVDGTFLGRRGSNRDATERVRAEEEINKLNEQLSYRLVDRIAQLDMANRELESYAYAVSHDVRTPLRAIDGFSETVLQDEGDKLSPGAVEDLRRVRAAAQEMARLMDDLLGFSKLTHRDLLRRSVDVSALAAEVAAEIAADDAARRVQVSIEPDLVADADPALLRMILRELLGNAWKFTSHHDSAHIEVGALRAGGELEFYVRDDGAGFDEQYAQHLFGLFQRMHPRGEFPGDGVGLATVQRLVRRHGGRVWAEAAVEKGATFSFTLPSEAGAAD